MRLLDAKRALSMWILWCVVVLARGPLWILTNPQGIVRMCRLPSGTQFDYPWTQRKVPLGEQVDHLAYSSPSDTYVIGTSQKTGFKLPENDELHHEWRNEGLFRQVG